MAELIPSTKNIPGLDKPADWVLWYKSVRAYAQTHRVWKYCDPDSSDTVPDEVPDPTIEQWASDNSNWYTIWRDRKADVERILERYCKVTQRIYDTVGPTYQNRIGLSDTPRDILRNLKDAVGYSSNIIESTLELELVRLYKGPGGSNLHQWLSDWNSLNQQAHRIYSEVLSEAVLMKRFVESAYSSNIAFAI